MISGFRIYTQWSWSDLGKNKMAGFNLEELLKMQEAKVVIQIDF